MSPIHRSSLLADRPESLYEDGSGGDLMLRGQLHEIAPVAPVELVIAELDQARARYE